MVFQRYPHFTPVVSAVCGSHLLPVVAIANDDPGSTILLQEMGLIDNGGYAVKKDGQIIAAHNLHEIVCSCQHSEDSNQFDSSANFGPPIPF